MFKKILQQDVKFVAAGYFFVHKWNSLSNKHFSSEILTTKQLGEGGFNTGKLIDQFLISWGCNSTLSEIID
jgi:hypothetical protein